MRKFIYLLSIFIFLICLISCSKKKDDRKTIEFWTLQLSPTFNNYFNDIISEYEKAHPDVDIIWVDIPYDAAIQKLLASAVAGNAPDVVNLSSDFLAKFAGMNALVDLSEFLPKDTFQIFLPSALENCTYNNKIVGLPWYLNTYVLIYNKEFFNKARLTEKDVPKSFNELVEITKKYKDNSGSYALFWNIGKDSYLPMMLGSEGVAMTDELVTKAAFNSPEGIELIDKWVQLYRNGYLQSESIIKPGSTIIEAYQSGQVAMVFTGPVFLRRVKDNAPSIYKSTDVAPAVVGKTGKHELAAMSISVMNSSRYKKEAVDFAFFVTNSENQIAFSKIETTYPSTVEALSDSFFTIDDGTLETKARIIGANELFDAVRLRKYLEHPQFDKLRDAFDEAIQKACLGKMTTKEALDEAADKWNQILANSNRAAKK